MKTHIKFQLGTSCHYVIIMSFANKCTHPVLLAIKAKGAQWRWLWLAQKVTHTHLIVGLSEGALWFHGHVPLFLVLQTESEDTPHSNEHLVIPNICWYRSTQRIKISYKNTMG